MNFYIQQSININFLKVEGITNSSVLQIGSAGMIKPVSNLYNSGGFKEPAPEALHPSQIYTGMAGPTYTQNLLEAPAVPLTSGVSRS
ncbi:spore germination protein GerPB [Bacillus sp. ISL-35]|uniref:spore germination protein GerPB n=1 Tax=Bacillus sp. ISL-35 TaxID=2819122 RepID=UPI001BEC8344|nr:spore germination protein GerPB [Bacillus sp. ISL-35]MBT2678140.1 spore germination protein GerPB [Bacillus sp. ISL-35]MBT2702573.1 spore germination protein GerPB [Chryseobacterium sp. ISL-80]